VYPRVTEILQSAGLVNFGMVNANILERASDFGIEGHRVCELDDYHKLDITTVDPAILPYLVSWQKWLVDYAFEITAIEPEVKNDKYRFQGHPDRVGLWQGRRTVVDIKFTTAISKVTAIQLAGYDLLLGGGYRRLVVQLLADGYKVVEYKDKSDKSVFLACLTINNFQERRK